MIKSAVRGLGVLTFAVCLFANAGVKADSIRFQVPAGDVATALEMFARQSGVEVLYQPDQLKGIRTRGVSGMLAPQNALAKLLEGTPLMLRVDSTGALSVSMPPTHVSFPLHSQSTDSSNAATDSPRSSLAVGDNTVQTHSNDIVMAQAGSPQVFAEAVSPQQSGQLEEIVVTATKREENIQRVPISLTALSADDIDRRGLVNEEDYLRGIPGVSQVAGSFGTNIIIRGLGTSPDANQNFTSGATTATYFGETPTTNSAGVGGGSNVDIKLVDIQRVEVLRGPQGTAFGSSSLGGAVRTIPEAPQLDKFQGKVGANFSGTSGTGGNNSMLQGIINLPVIEGKVAVRATAYEFYDSGYYTNNAGSDPAIQAAAVTYGAQALATSANNVGSLRTTGGRIAALFQATDDLKVSVSYLTQRSDITGQTFATNGTYTQATFQVAPEDVIRGRTDGVFDTNIHLANATAEYNLGWSNILATVSYIRSGSEFAAPLSPYTFPYSSAARSSHEETNGEIRLTTKLNGAWNFLGGFYFENPKDQSTYDFYWAGSATSNIFGPPQFLGEYIDHRDLKQKALFGEVSWDFAQYFTLTGGVRAYKYQRQETINTDGTFFGTAVTAGTADASDTSYRGNLSYKPTPNALIYATWSQGFRLGKPQPGLPSQLCDSNGDGLVDGTNVPIASTRILNSDSVDNTELGAKFTLLDSRLLLSADVFRIRWSGVPFLIGAPPPPVGCGLTYDANAGNAKSEGIEAQASAYAARALRVDVGASFVHAWLTQGSVAAMSAAGDRLPGSPEFNANLGVQYEFDVMGHKAYVRADSIYVGTFYDDIASDPFSKAGGYIKLDTSARVTIQHLNVDLFVHNVTNSDAFTLRSTSDQGPFFGYRLRPRTVGVQLMYDF